MAFNWRAGSLGWHGNAILVRKGMRVAHCAMLHLPSLEPRGAVLSEVDVGAKCLRVVGMHLDLSGLWRRRQMRAILDAIANRHIDKAVAASDDLITFVDSMFDSMVSARLPSECQKNSTRCGPPRKREPKTTSASPWRIGASRVGYSRGSYSRSASWISR